ncbi:alanine dehydrogenase [Candidatus Micrarchaeota archaeon]|nr:alanine dehydrogenase [Candidatus Micrarchaeota archaeon]
MIVGLLREIKKDEYRVALTPSGAEALAGAGHEVLVEKGAGEGSGFSDSEYSGAGAKIISTPAEVCSRAKLILKVKEPLEQEFAYFNSNHIIFTYFHFASNRKLTEAMLATKAACVAYETVEFPGSRFPLLAPMSEVAGKMAPLMAATFLAKQHGGRGVLVAPVGKSHPAKFVVLGSGVAGGAAANLASAMGAEVTVITLGADTERGKFPHGVTVMESTPSTVEREVTGCDALIGAVYRAGSKAPVLVSRAMVAKMRRGSVIVDIAIDQGGCVETSHPTTHSQPTFVEEGVIHYCVANMPGAYPRTSTMELTAATLPYALALGAKGLGALAEDEAFIKGLNCLNGTLTSPGVSKAHGIPFTPSEEALAAV